jgi:hypothetical protein
VNESAPANAAGGVNGQVLAHDTVPPRTDVASDAAKDRVSSSASVSLSSTSIAGSATPTSVVAASSSASGTSFTEVTVTCTPASLGHRCRRLRGR